MTAGSIVVPRVIPIRIPLLGKAKHEIDTSTPVEIRSDTLGVTIYYTLDGSKPEVARRPGFGESSTHKYTTPVCLPEGKVYVKAMAVTRDGRESAVVTKLFLVEKVSSNKASSTEDNEENVLKNSELDLSKQGTAGGGTWPVTPDHGSEESSLRLQVPKVRGGGASGSPKAPRFLGRRLGLASPVESTSAPRSLTLNASWEDSPFKNLTNTQMSRIQRETDFLRCVRCLSQHPADPFTRFCLQCGTAVPPIPGQRLPPTEGGQMGLCIYCKTMVPLNTPTCIVCEAPIGPQLQPQASLRLQDKLICQSCGTGNPGHISNCVTCEDRLPLPPTAVLSGQSAPPLPSGENKMVSCSKCSRVNHSDARFCDWCGAKPGHRVVYLTCSRCGATSPPYASFCGCCGVFMEGPPRPESRASAARSTGGAVEPDQTSPRRSDSAATWQPVSASVAPAAPALAHADRQTQTAGLFYPSATDILRKAQQEVLERDRQEQARDRRTLLTAISPGRGYWRKQLDHVCAHLRSYTQNNTDFRALMGEPRMGKMVSAVIKEDNYEVSLRINFVSAKHEKTKLCQGGGAEKSVALSESLNLSSVMEGRSVQSTSLTSQGKGGAGAPGRSLKKLNPSRASEAAHTPPSTRTSRLLQEVGPDGGGRISVVQQMLDEGADPMCQGSDGRPALAVAVMNGHHDVIPVLVQRGADINQQSGQFNNTALHEAAARGRRGLLCAETLLGCNASMRRKNARGQSAYDLAVGSECSPMISLIAAKMGQGLLDRLVQLRTDPGPAWD